MALLTTKQAAEKLAISIPRIHQLINEGRLPAEKVGRDYVINDSDLNLVADRKPGRPRKAQTEKPLKRTSKKGKHNK